MSVPEQIRKQLKDKLWVKADEIGWIQLSLPDKKKWYENWTKEKEVGGVLSRFLEVGQVRVYLKDTLLKDYTRNRLGDYSRVYQALGITSEVPKHEFEKPHGHQLDDGRMLCWGKADNWKSILLAVFERSFSLDGKSAFAAVLIHSTGRYHEDSSRAIVEEVARRLQIERLIWLD